MTLPVTAIRGLLHRGRSTIMIFLLAVVGTAAAAAGPAYYQAAKTSILHDSLGSANFEGRGFEATESGPIPGLLGGLSGSLAGPLASYLGPLNRSHLFAAPVDSIEASAGIAPWGAMPLVYRTGFCAHIRIQGSCPLRRNQILISQPLAKATGWRIGQRSPRQPGPRSP